MGGCECVLDFLMGLKLVLSLYIIILAFQWLSFYTQGCEKSYLCWGLKVDKGGCECVLDFLVGLKFVLRLYIIIISFQDIYIYKTARRGTFTGG